ncbi:CRISPR-associated endonuclease Cas1 [Sphingobium sp. HBC34]|uniref:CRISPR-associated endonuclease Cas1 n=1 Tax=Sphingobium cyanobacteriorum TaxID=3063954 RepID=A0ABT8ZKN9_9SPHN|nr:CRISPR-associated endonuclease Cas1 [Sphingobium sp. HBC34]MDO7834355.1 CRISPR-associated endonuclease Cas1 [Sphingobium sp. HBC34]
MFEKAISPAEHSSDEWAIRSEYWMTESRKSQRKRLTRERNSNALILTGQGTSLRVEGGALVIRQGFSHYPQQRESHRYFKGDLALPRIIILLDGSGSLSFDVLNWLGEQGVALARIKADGDVAVVASGAGFTANPDNLRWQYATQKNEAARLAFAADLIARKLDNSIATIEGQFGQGRLRTAEQYSTTVAAG